MEQMSDVKTQLEELRIRYESEEPSPYLDNVGSLGRYFIWADKMRHEFHLLIADHESYDEVIFLEYVHLYMSYWYAALYVVIEGWQALKLEDAAIDKLLDSSHLDLLRRYRNAVFHFQKKYSDERFMKLMLAGEENVDWVRSIHLELGRYFLAWWKARKEAATSSAGV